MSSVVLAYVGPEAALPLLSVLAAIFGAILVGWRWIVAVFRRVILRKGPPEPKPAESAPETSAEAERPAEPAAPRS